MQLVRGHLPVQVAGSRDPREQQRPSEEGKAWMLRLKDRASWRLTRQQHSQHFCTQVRQLTLNARAARRAEHASDLGSGSSWQSWLW
eukprot:1144286-Pelagomonas_calceolata.AAC.2